MSDEPFTLKESLFNRDTVDHFAAGIKAVHRPFDSASFINQVIDESWADRPLMDRLHHVTRVLHEHLPDDYRQSIKILLDSNPHMPSDGFINMIQSDFAAVYGLEDPDASIPAIEQFTQVMSAEFAVRHFIARYPNRMMAQMLLWADHPHEGVRRLSSEGCRPRLPWGIRLYDLIKDPRPILPILEKLKNDLSESVRRSVANNLNDISKDNPAVSLDVLKRWNAGAENNKGIQWITSHALRTLLKAGNEDALELLGYPADPQIDVSDVNVEPTSISIGESVTLTFKIRSTGNTSQNLMIDYLVYHMRANGRQTSKVFKIKKITLTSDQVIEIKKNHSFRPVTTRNYYTGPHGVQPQINGRLFERVDFELAL